MEPVSTGAAASSLDSHHNAAFACLCCLAHVAATVQGAAKEAGEVPPPITPKGPQNVSGEWNLIQALNGPKDQQVKETRGYENGPPGIANDNDDVGVDVALSGRSGGDMHITQSPCSRQVCN